MKAKRKYKVPTIPDSIWQDPWHFIAFGFGAGALPVAPGTFGTLVAIPFYLVLGIFQTQTYLFILLLLTLGSIWICGRVSKQIKVHDHQGMCLDEIIGFLFTMIAVPAKFSWILFGFLLFRFFDIYKPWPIDRIDKEIKGGAGMILDDVVAGIFSCIILHIAMRIFGA